MNIVIQIAVFQKVKGQSGMEVLGPVDVLSFDEDDLLEILRRESHIPPESQYDWQIQEIRLR